jgi:hypothetical protein
VSVTDDRVGFHFHRASTGIVAWNFDVLSPDRDDSKCDILPSMIRYGKLMLSDLLNESG